MPPKFNKLAGTSVLVIGGSSGVGYAVAQGSLASGAKVTISSSQDSKLASKVHALRADFPHSDVRSFVCDLSQIDRLEEELEKLLVSTGPFDHVVFTAGDAHQPKAIHDISLDHIIRAGKVRFFAPLFLAKILPQHMTSRSNQCSLTFTNSWSAGRSTGGWPVEHAYTVALSGLTQTLAIDLKPIRVNVVGLGLIDTEIFESGGMTGEEKERMFTIMRQKLLTNEIPTPDNVAETYLGLMRDNGVTGSALCSDSGMRLISM